MEKPLVPRVPPEPREAYVNEINRLHDEMAAVITGTVHQAIRAGQLLAMYKARIPHGGWRKWVRANIDFNYRSVRRYMLVYVFRVDILQKGISSVNQAEIFLRKSKGIGQTAIDADYARIDRDLVAPIRLVRRRIRKVTYNDPENPETMEMIWEELQQQAEGLLSDLSSEDKPEELEED